MKKLAFLLLGVMCLALLGACAPASASGQEPPREDFTAAPSGAQPASSVPTAPSAPLSQTALPYRAMWISYLEWPMLNVFDADAFAAAAAAMMDNCVTMGLNTVIVQVRPFSDAIYPSAIFPWSHLTATRQGVDPGFDPLAVFVEEAHARGLLIEAWINPYRVRLNDNMPVGELAPEHPAVRHPEWVREASGGLYYDPALPEVQNMVVDGVVELLQNYDVDGIQFDDYFYPTTDPSFDAESYERYANGQDLAEWRRENVNTLVKKVYEAVKATRPAAVFGISPQGNNDNNYNQQYSDVGLWLSTPGYVDYIMPQVYWGYHYRLQSGSDRFAFENIVREWMTMPRSASVSLAFGLGAYRIGEGDGSSEASDEWTSGHNLADMARTLQAMGADGYGVYRYASLYGGGDYETLMQAERTALAEANGMPTY